MVTKKGTGEALSQARQEARRVRAKIRTLERQLEEEKREAALVAKAVVADAILVGVTSDLAARKWVRGVVAAMDDTNQDVLRAGLPAEVTELLFGEPKEAAGKDGFEEAGDGRSKEEA